MFLRGSSKAPTPVSATPTHMLRICVNSPTRKNPNIANRKSKNALSIPSAHKPDHARPAFIAGVQTMRARICSAFSCDMFARVV